MKVWSDGFGAGDRIPERYAFGKDDGTGHFAPSENLNPPISWSNLPAGTRSLVLTCHDTEVPTVGTDVNQEGRTVPYDLPRADFTHWVLVDIDPGSVGIPQGAHASGIVARGKPGPDAMAGTRHGVNDYTGWFAGDADMSGQYHGYDGPCPPWNDERLHRYSFTLYALNVDRAPVSGTFTRTDVLSAIEGHVLESASFGGTYAINPDARD